MNNSYGGNHDEGQSNKHSGNETKVSSPKCPICQGNKSFAIGKGYSYLFAVVMVGFLFMQSIEFKSTREHGLEAKSRDVPTGLVVFSGLLICGALGINTDPLAEAVGKILSK